MKKTLVLVVLAMVMAAVMAIPSQAASIWEKRKQAVEGVKDKAEEPAVAGVEEGVEEPMEEESIDTTALDPEDIFIPDQYGTIIETHKGTNGKLIVHIQSAHCNYEGQKNAADILESLVEDYNLRLILTEGAHTDKDLTYLRERASLEARKRAAERLLKDSTITGPEYLGMVCDYPLAFQGIEDKDLYKANKNALWEIDKFKELASEYVIKMITAADALKPKIYNQDLLDFDSKKKDYDAEKIDLLAYYEYLYKTAEAKEIPLYTFPNFENLIKASDLEKKIDLAKVRDGSATDEEMSLYNDYMDATKNLNINDLFKEEPLLQGVLEDTLAVNQDQRTLLRVSKALVIMKNLLRIKVVPEEYKYFTENKKDFDPVLWQDSLQKKSEELGISANIPQNYLIISDNIQKIEQFYNIANEREKVFLKKSQERMEEENVDLAALIAGGFHTPTLTKLLADGGYSYIVVSPKVTTETDDALYRSILKR